MYQAALSAMKNEIGRVIQTLETIQNNAAHNISVLDKADPPPQKPLSKTSESQSDDYRIIYICQILLNNTF